MYVLQNVNGNLPAQEWISKLWYVELRDVQNFPTFQNVDGDLPSQFIKVAPFQPELKKKIWWSSSWWWQWWYGVHLISSFFQPSITQITFKMLLCATATGLNFTPTRVIGRCSGTDTSMLVHWECTYPVRDIQLMMLFQHPVNCLIVLVLQKANYRIIGFKFLCIGKNGTDQMCKFVAPVVCNHLKGQHRSSRVDGSCIGVTFRFGRLRVEIGAWSNFKGLRWHNLHQRTFMVFIHATVKRTSQVWERMRGQNSQSQDFNFKRGKIIIKETKLVR